MLTDKLKSEIREYSLYNKGKEICGLLIKKDSKVIFYKCRNISYYTKNNCILDPFDYIRASELGKIIGHVHSQENKSPTFIDYSNAISHNIYSIIYSWKYDKFSIIEPSLKEYLNLDYHSEKHNCFELIRSYYKEELNIKISKYNVYNKEEPDKFNYILRNYKKEGFYPVDLQYIRENDIILFNILSLPHLSVYMNNDFILHHPENDKSIISELTKGLKKRINIVLRHKDIEYE